ncbi:conserved hypothetical protein [Trichormus variabilis ATCC 29413]|uniref:Uncharacterized protein n=2 Tax=Anabaena variabilis TaxID=264691 RepID=Q3MBZ2_TRIV2|nr:MULTISPECIES: hypothetical protein [Nostocaceae]ABA21494.1 conserved hypothetical protein [Trichormus variabilis ATCC 29413]MBC1213361.1 hypothetical protein [Trichormus variabilis ARAD]MBC1254722.1 hypothetical protein [Trichormus variabilis V5]MBC1268212.1 hypothetical protein [Trichormus variabilis FSR]MBC1301162.1 hypothetical protein [Trichormus variabilis N2B]
MANRKLPKKQNLYFERLMATIATLNLFLVLFDLSYVPWRDFYLRKVPEITKVYDPIKGIEQHRETQNYLNKINLLKAQVSQTGITSPEVKTQLQEISRLSNEMIEGNPFAAVGKSGTLERIKKRMRDRIGNDSAKQSFATFWSQPYLSQKGWIQEITFFNQKISPLIATNYYRQIGENNEFINYFWLIDLPFVCLFGLELLGRVIYIRSSHPGFSWLNAILWRWYDLFLLIPFWRWLRIIPVTIRLDHARLLNLQPINKQIHQVVVANFAEELTEIVIIRVINQIQGSIQKGEITRWLLQNDKLRPYIDINDINEVEAIAGLLVQTIVDQVLPKIQPELVALLQHNINSAFHQVPIYKNLQSLPGVGQAQTQISEQLATQITTNLYNVLVSAIKDPIGAKLSSQLAHSFTQALGNEIQQKHVLSEIQSLLVDFLEEVKLNYVQRLSQEDIDQIIEQTRQLKSIPNSIVRSKE